MPSHKLKLGVIGGLTGGIAMGMWMMGYYWASGRGLWEPLGYIGHFFLRIPIITHPLQVAIGLMVHMIVSLGLGIAIASILPRAFPLAAVMGGLFLAVVVWALMQYGVLDSFDDVAYRGLVRWAFAVGHLIYGATLGLFVGVPRPKAPASRAASGRDESTPTVLEVRPANSWSPRGFGDT